MGQSEKMEQEDNRPKWLLELENRKRKPRLAHEVGAGAPCMTCSTACPGLDLHFWRKICKNCKCSRDDHDVPNDEFPQFDLLFGPTGKPNRKMIVLKVNKKQEEAESTFEWAPPDTTKELAADYMKALPEDKLPIKGSAGAALRKQQLQRQLPLHDIDHKVCDELSDSERKQFEKYLENLKKYVGQGKVIKAMGARPFDISLMTPANATDMNRFSPKHKPNPPEASHTLNLRTPSSFVQKTPFSPHSVAEGVNGLQKHGIGLPARDQCPSSSTRVEKVHSPALGNSSYESPLQGRYHHVLANVRNEGETLSSKPVGGTRNPALHFATTNKIPDPAYSSLTGENKPINSRLQSSFNPQNTNLASSNPVGGIYNPAVQFAASNMIGDPSILMNSARGNENAKSGSVDRGLNYATSNTLSDQELSYPSSADAKFHSSKMSAPVENLAISSSISGIYNPGFNVTNVESDKNTELELGKLHSSRNPAENLAISSSVHGTYNPGFNVLQNDRKNSEFDKDGQSELAKNREEENSLLAEKMLNEALLPPSAIHAADIIGSTLDEKGLSFIREKLTSKYSAKEDPVILQSAGRARDLGENKTGAKSKQTEQLRRQGAFDKEPERTDVIAAMRNPSGTISHAECPTEYLGDSIPSSSQMENCRQGQNSLGERLNQDNSNYPLSDVIGTNQKNISGEFKDESGKEPWRQIMQGICDDYLTKPGYPGDVRRLQDKNSSDIDKENISGGSSINSEPSYPGSASKALKAELSSYGPGNSDVICSVDLNNPVFPEEAIVSSGIVQNPVSVDRLRGAMEELSMCQSKMQNCHQCQECVRPGDVVVTAEKANDAVWHPGCFVCSVCNELLADLVYFYYKGKLYCGRDLATLLKIPRCFACDELIFVREYTVAEGHNYHIKHFCCWDCDEPLAGQQYISENDRPLCLPCYQRTYAKTCGTCEGVIAADQQGVAVKNLNFHANDDCFCCATCKKSLLNGKMAIKEDRPFCSKECITKFLNDKSS